MAEGDNSEKRFKHFPKYFLIKFDGADFPVLCAPIYMYVLRRRVPLQSTGANGVVGYGNVAWKIAN